MATEAVGWTLAELAQVLGGRVEGDPEKRVLRPVPAGDSDPDGIAFAENADYLEMAEGSGVGALILSEGSAPTTKPCIRVGDARAAFGRLLALADRPVECPLGVHPTAVVHPSAHVAESASLGPYCVVEEGAQVGDGARIFAFSYVGARCTVGPGATVLPHAVLLRDVDLGAGAIVHSGAVLGADGFGFAWDGRRRIKIPQVGSVVIGQDSEVGANSCVDRATCGRTVVGEGTKLDNLVQIGHNVSIGSHGVVAGLTGVAGSTRIGDRAVIGGHVAIADHVSIAADVTLAGRTGVAQDIDEAGAYLGTPARPVRETMRIWALLRRLPELFQRVKDLERRGDK